MARITGATQADITFKAKPVWSLDAKVTGRNAGPVIFSFFYLDRVLRRFMPYNTINWHFDYTQGAPGRGNGENHTTFPMKPLPKNLRKDGYSRNLKFSARGQDGDGTTVAGGEEPKPKPPPVPPVVAPPVNPIPPPPFNPADRYTDPYNRFGQLGRAYGGMRGSSGGVYIPNKPWYRGHIDNLSFSILNLGSLTPGDTYLEPDEINGEYIDGTRPPGERFSKAHRVFSIGYNINDIIGVEEESQVSNILYLGCSFGSGADAIGRIAYELEFPIINDTRKYVAYLGLSREFTAVDNLNAQSSDDVGVPAYETDYTTHGDYMFAPLELAGGAGWQATENILLKTDISINTENQQRWNIINFLFSF